MSAAGPLRGPHKGGGCAAAVLVAPAKRTGPPPRPPGCCASPCGRRPCRAALDPGDPCGPWEQEKRAGHSLPRPDAGATRTALPGRDHYNRSLHGFRGTPPRTRPAGPETRTSPPASPQSASTPATADPQRPRNFHAATASTRHQRLIRLKGQSLRRGGSGKTSAAALSMITKEKSRRIGNFSYVIMKISRLRSAPVGRPEGAGKDLGTSNPSGRERHSKSGHGAGDFTTHDHGRRSLDLDRSAL